MTAESTTSATGERATSATRARPLTRCSRVGTGRNRYMHENRNSVESRRLGELCDEIAGEVSPGGWPTLSAPLRRTVKRAALLMLEIEALGGARTRGEAIDRTDLAALNNQLTRLEDRLRAAEAAAPKPAAPSLAEIAADIARSGASIEADVEADE